MMTQSEIVARLIRWAQRTRDQHGEVKRQESVVGAATLIRGDCIELLPAMKDIGVLITEATPGFSHSWTVWTRSDSVMKRLGAAGDIEPLLALLGAMPGPLTVVDPFMGPQAIVGVAALRTGHGFVGIEIDDAAYNAACRRLKEI